MERGLPAKHLKQLMQDISIQQEDPNKRADRRVYGGGKGARIPCQGKKLEDGKVMHATRNNTTGEMSSHLLPSWCPTAHLFLHTSKYSTPWFL